MDIPEKDKLKLQKLAKQREVSLAHLVRQAVEAYLKEEGEGLGEDTCFGLWQGRKIDALKYQEKLRKEWSKE